MIMIMTMIDDVDDENNDDENNDDDDYDDDYNDDDKYIYHLVISNKPQITDLAL